MDRVTDLFYAGFLGLVAGFVPVYLGLAPLPLFKRLSDGARAVLVSFSAGILLFLFADVTHEGVDLTSPAGGGASPLLFVVGLLAGLFGPVFVSQVARARGQAAARTSGAGSARLFVAYAIALGIGLHNLGEGLAIGAAYAAGLSLTTLLVIGFFLHNSTEGLGMMAPIASTRTGWREPLLLGFFAGFPTIVGSMIGSVAYSDALSALFFATAAGALLYVIVEMLRLLQAFDRSRVYAGIVLGILLMYVTDLLVAV